MEEQRSEQENKFHIGVDPYKNDSTEITTIYRKVDGKYIPIEVKKSKSKSKLTIKEDGKLGI